MTSGAKIGIFDMAVETIRCNMSLDELCPISTKTHVQMDGYEFVGNGRLPEPFFEEPEGEQAVSAAGYGYHYPVAVGQKVVLVYCLSYFSVDFFEQVTHGLGPDTEFSGHCSPEWIIRSIRLRV